MARPKQHPGYIERHGTGYRVSLCVRGRRHRFTVHAESKADAAEWAAAKHKELKAAGARRDQGYPAPLHMSELLRPLRARVDARHGGRHAEQLSRLAQGATAVVRGGAARGGAA